jgi:DNA polymerase-3 subunit alpha
MHTIFCCVREGEKQTTPIGRGRGYRFGLPNQNTISRRGGEKNSLLTCLKRWNLAEIVDKIEIYNWRFYYPI